MTGTGTLTLAGLGQFSGPTTLVGGTLALANSAALAMSTLNINGGVLNFVGSTSAALGGLSGSGNVALDNTALAAVTLSAGNNNQSTTYSGVLSGDGSLSKVGSGTLVLNASNTYSGATTVGGGILQLAATAPSAAAG